MEIVGTHTSIMQTDMPRRVETFSIFIIERPDSYDCKVCHNFVFNWNRILGTIRIRIYYIK